MNEIFEHPNNPEEAVVGRRLTVGEKIKRGDVFPSPKDKKWVEAGVEIGLTIKVKRTPWIRPVV